MNPHPLFLVAVFLKWLVVWWPWSYLTHRLWQSRHRPDTVGAVPDRASTQARLGRAVKQIRVKRGLTQEQVSAASGLHPTYISDIERGARNPSWQVITRLADGIGVTTSEIAEQYDTQDEQHD